MLDTRSPLASASCRYGGVLALTNSIDFAISIVGIQRFFGPARWIVADLHEG
jgi:hypothetical protein